MSEQGGSIAGGEGLTVGLVARTEFRAPTDVPWRTDADGASALAEFAGRACYQSWSKPRPATATNAGYLSHLLAVGHLSVLEHASATFYITGISRSVTHELLRHRHLSVSELSQRHTPPGGPQFVPPPAVRAEPDLLGRFTEAVDAAGRSYRNLLEVLDADPGLPPGGLGRKLARQAARSVLPHAEATAAVVTGNMRSWRHFIGMRATDAADPEIRGLAVAVLKELRTIEPNLFADFRVTELPDGTETAASPLVGDG